jgi:hypothetical protein
VRQRRQIEERRGKAKPEPAQHGTTERAGSAEPELDVDAKLEGVATNGEQTEAVVVAKGNNGSRYRDGNEYEKREAVGSEDYRG